MFSTKIPVKWLRYLLIFEVEGPILWFGRDRGSQFKGLLAKWMRSQFECEPTFPCKKCSKSQEKPYCDFPLIFEPQIYGSEKTPSWLILPPLNRRNVLLKGERISVEIRTFGELASHELFIKRFLPSMELGMMIKGIGNWIEKGVAPYGRILLLFVHIWQKNGWLKIYDREKRLIEKDFLPLTEIEAKLPQQANSWKIDFITPVCLTKNGNSILSPSFADVVEASFRRIYYLLNERREEFSKWGEKSIEMAKSVETISSNFHIHEIRSKKMVMDGFKKDKIYVSGELVVKKIPDELFPLLFAGGLTHIGKGVSQGYGGFVIRGETAEISQGD
jgi:hypothetical protein